MRTLLLIADDLACVREVRLALRQAPGFRVVATLDGRAPAAAALRRLAPEVVVVDEMCQRSYALARIREAGDVLPDGFTVLLTRGLEMATLEDVLDAGARAVIHRPLPPATLATLLTEVVAGHVVHVPRRRAANASPERPEPLRAPAPYDISDARTIA